MAPKKAKAQKQNLRQELTGLFGHLSGELIHLVDAAVRGQFTEQEFTHRLVHTQQFRQAYPGLISGGKINAFLGGSANAPVTFTNLVGASQAYGRALEQYQLAASHYGTTFNKKMMAAALKAEVSPNEYLDRLHAADYVNSHPEVAAAFKQIDIANGGSGSTQDIYKAAAGAKDRPFYDRYEAARLQAGGTGLTGQEAIAAAHGLPYTPGQPLDIGAVVQGARDLLGQASGQLEQGGISRGDLLKFVADPNADPDLAGKINQIIQAQKSLASSYVPGMQNRQGSGGGLAQFDQEQQASYG